MAGFEIKMSPYAGIRWAAMFGNLEVIEYVVYMDGKEGKHIKNKGEMIMYARGLCDGGFEGDILIRTVQD